MAIIIAGTVDVAPETRERTLLEARPLIEAARAEPGCIAYAWTADLSEPGRIHVFEEWASEADLAYHFTAEPYQQMLAHLHGAGIVAAVTQKYRIDHAEPVYDPEGRPRADFFSG